LTRRRREALFDFGAAKSVDDLGAVELGVRDIADVVSFLAGPKARWVTGQAIEVTGGSALTF
jgi:NAD(P)-dependent dehydrogenase (short-subunit alcohol dehydrogenase family)